MKKQIDCTEKDWSELCIPIDKAMTSIVDGIKNKSSDDHTLQIVLENISAQMVYYVTFNLIARSDLPIVVTFPDKQTCVLDIDFGQTTGSKYRMSLDCSAIGVEQCRKAIRHLLHTFVIPSLSVVREVEIHLMNTPSEFFRDILLDKLNVDKSRGMLDMYRMNGVWFTIVESYLGDPARTEKRFPHNFLN